MIAITQIVTTPPFQNGGFSGSLRRLKAPSEPVFVAISMEGRDPLSMSLIGTQTVFVR